MNRYASLDEFYQNKWRRHSPECDYGCWWQGASRFPPYRVSYIKETGDVYAVAPGGPVEVLAVVVSGVEGSAWHRALDEILAGWEDECEKPNSLNWVRQRLAGRE